MKTSAYFLFFVLQACSYKQDAIEELQEHFKSVVPQVERKVGKKLSIIKEMYGCIYTVKLEEVWKNISVKFLQKILFPDINLSRVSGRFLNTDRLKVAAYSLNVCDGGNPTYGLSVNTYSYNLANTRFVVNDLSMLLTFPAFSSRLAGMKSIAISKGNAFYNFDGEAINVHISSEYDRNHVTCRCSFKNISFVKVLQIFQREPIKDIFLGEVQNSQGLELKLLEFINADLEGYILPGESFEFQITGGARGVEVFSRASKTFVIVQKSKEEVENVKFLLFSLLENYDLSQFINHYVSIPFFQIVDGTVALMVSDGRFSNFLNEAIQIVMNSFLAGADLRTISREGIFYFYRIKNMPTSENEDFKEVEGVFASNTTNFPVIYSGYPEADSWEKGDSGSKSSVRPPDKRKNFFSGIKELQSGKNLPVSSYTKYIIIKMTIDGERVVLKPMMNLTKEFKPMMKYIFGEEYSQDVEAVPLDEKKEVFLQRVQVQPFGVKKDSTIVKVSLETSIDVLINMIEVNPIVFDVSRTFGVKEAWLIDISEMEEQASKKLKIVNSEKDKKHFITGEMDIYSQTDATKYLSQTTFFNGTLSRFEELVDFPYKSATFKMELQKEAAKCLSISARTIIFSQKDVPLETVIWKQESIQLATVFRLTNVGLDEVLNKLYQTRMLKFSWLTLKNMEIALKSKVGNLTGIFSSVFGDFISPKNKSVVVIRGELSVNLKTACLEEPICNFIKNHITHNLDIEIKGNALRNSYALRATFKNVTKSFGDVWGLTSLELKIAGSNEKDSKVQLSGKIVHKETKHVGNFFVGEDEMSGKAELKITFDQPWKNFLGYSVLTLKSMRARTDISRDEGIKTLDFNAKIEIGNTNKPIFINKAVVTLSINSKSSENDDVVYAFLRGLTMDELSNAFKNFKVNRLLENTVFSDELVLGFTQNKNGKTVKELGNYRFYPSCSGVWSMSTFFGNLTSCVDFTDGLKITFQPKRLSYFNDKLVFLKSETNDVDGPEFVFEMTSTSEKDKRDSFLHGFIKTIGYQGYIRKSLSSDDLTFNFTGYVFNEVKMNVSLSNLFGKDSVKITASLDVPAAMPEITENIRQLIRDAHEKIKTKILDKFNELLSGMKEIEQELKLKRDYLLNRNSERRNNIFKRRLLIEEANEAIKSDCVDICGNKCVESLDWSSDCTVVTGQPLGCLKWKKCNYLAADTKCIASCEALKIPTSISAHYERDEIRNLAEDINTTKNRIDAIDILLKKLIKLKQQSSSKFGDFQNRTLFVKNLNDAKQELFEFTNEIPTSTQQLADINIPELRFNSISYKFLGQTFAMNERTFFINHNFFWEFAEAAVEGAEKRFKTLTELIDGIKAEAAEHESLFFDFKNSYSNQEKEDRENLEENGEDNEERNEISDENLEDGRTALDSEKFKFLFNPTFGNRAVKNVTIVKRSINEDTDDDAIDKRLTESLEIKIHPYVTKGSKTVNAFKRHASWVLIKSREKVNISSPGPVRKFGKHHKDVCLTKRNTVRHFKDLVKSLEDLKRFYIKGKRCIGETKRRLLVEKKDIDKQIKTARDVVPTSLDRDDMIYWLRQSRDGIDQQLKTLNQQLAHQNNVGIKYWASQLNSLTQSEIPKTSSSYFHELKKKISNQLMKTKRSNISGRNFLNSVIEEFIRIAESEPSVASLTSNLSKLTKNISLFKRSLPDSCIL